MRLLLPSLCLLSSTFGTRAKVVVADGTKQVDDNRLQDNVAVAPGPLQPVSRGLRRGGNGGKLTPIKLDESNAQELVDSGTDDLASEDMFYAMELSAKSVKSAKGHHKTKSAKGHHKTKSAKTMPTSTPPTPESGRSGASGASEVDDYYYYGGYYYYGDGEFTLFSFMYVIPTRPILQNLSDGREDDDEVDGECVNGDAFKDSMDFNCTLYEGAHWCEVNDEGKTVEGPGWCSDLNQECDVLAERRWSRHKAFKNQQGQWAKSCCCDTGLDATYPYEGGGECTDAPDNKVAAWHDQYGYSCRAYHFGSFCTLAGEPGSGWDPKNGDIAGYVREGMSPLDACCTCGGGIWEGGRMPNSTPPTPETGTSGASGASEVDDYYYYGGYYYYDDDGRSGRSGASEQEPNMSPTPAPSTTSTRPTPETGGIIESPAPTTTSTTSTRPTPETGGIESCTASGIECGYISFPDNTRTGCFSDPSICCSGNVDNYRHDSGGTEYFRCAPMCVMDNSCVCDRPIDDDNNPPPKKNACLANEPEASAQEAECKNQYPGRYEKCSDLCGYAKCLRPLTACTEEMEDFLSCHMQWGACSCDDNGTSGAFGASEVDDYYYYGGYYYYYGAESIGGSEQDPISPTPETTTPSTSPMGYGSTTRSKVSELDVVELDANVSKRGKSAKLNLFG